MTREEREQAIAIIRKEYLCVDRDCDIERNCGKCDLMMPSKEPILEAYKMAMDALEQLQTCGTCRNEDTYHCAECENKSDYEQAQADGEKSFKMRDATPEEQEAIDKYIKSISKPTGINFWDLADGEYISKEKAIIQLSWDLSEVELPRIKESLDKLPSVAIPNKTEIEAILQRFYNEEISCADMVQEMINLGFVIER